MAMSWSGRSNGSAATAGCGNYVHSHLWRMGGPIPWRSRSCGCAGSKTGLRAPEPQRPVDGPGTTWFLDLGVDELFFAVEYDGEEFHTEDDDIEHDADRRSWIRGNTPWTVEVITKQQLFRGDVVFESLLRKWLPEARRTLANRVRGRRWFQNPGD